MQKTIILSGVRMVRFYSNINKAYKTYWTKLLSAGDVRITGQGMKLGRLNPKGRVTGFSGPTFSAIILKFVRGFMAFTVHSHPLGFNLSEKGNS